MTEIIGYLAALFGTSTMIPQIIKSLKTKKVNDISLTMLSIYITGAALWVTYGFLIEAVPIILADGLVFIIALIQIFLKIKYQTYYEKNN